MNYVCTSRLHVSVSLHMPGPLEDWVGEYSGLEDTSRVVHVGFGRVEVGVCAEQLWDQRQNERGMSGAQELQTPGRENSTSGQKDGRGSREKLLPRPG